MNDPHTLYIPINIKTRTEIFEGFGIPELRRTIVSTLVCGGAALLLYKLGVIGLVALIVLLLSSAAGGVIFTAKDRGSNLSVYDQIVLMLRFSRAVKQYPYIYMDEWAA